MDTKKTVGFNNLHNFFVRGIINGLEMLRAMKHNEITEDDLNVEQLKIVARIAIDSADKTLTNMENTIKAIKVQIRRGE